MPPKRRFQFHLEGNREIWSQPLFPWQLQITQETEANVPLGEDQIITVQSGTTFTDI